jgi:asparagine synthetase A
LEFNSFDVLTFIPRSFYFIWSDHIHSYYQTLEQNSKKRKHMSCKALLG